MNDKEFNLIISNILINPEILRMKGFRQHYNVSTFEHAYMVSYYMYKICKKLGLDYVAGARAGLLHDFYLYDWREKSNWHRFHAFKHGNFAFKNAIKHFNLSLKERDMIRKHMWPVTFSLPRYKETYLLTFVDKYCALLEAFNYYKGIWKNKKRS